MRDTIDLRTDAEYDMLINKAMDLQATLTCQYYTGLTVNDIVYFDFSAYSGATLMVKQNYRSNIPVLVFDTLDGSIVLGATTGGTFQLKKTSTQLSTLPIGEMLYFMWLRSTTESHRAFLSGKFIIESVIL